MNNIYGKVKQLSEADKKANEKERIIPVIASTATKDRSGDILNMEGWELDNFMANPIIGYQHNVYGAGMCEPADTPDNIIGKAISARVEDNQLLIDIKFKPKGRSELADKVYQDMVEGYLNAVSVGFMAKENDKGQHYRKGDPENGEDPTAKYFFGQELLELSVVNLPDNPTALRRSLKSQTTNALSFIRKKTGLKFGEIEKMTVGDLIDLVETGKKPAKKVEKKVEEEEKVELPFNKLEMILEKKKQLITINQ